MFQTTNQSFFIFKNTFFVPSTDGQPRPVVPHLRAQSLFQVDPVGLWRTHQKLGQGMDQQNDVIQGAHLPELRHQPPKFGNCWKVKKVNGGI